MSNHHAANDAGPVSNFETNSASFRRSSTGGRADPPERLRRRVLDIEQALVWAYRDELPKRSAAQGPTITNFIASMMELGTAVDSWGGEPGFPLACGEPHPDALLIDAAVQRLESLADTPLDSDLELAPQLAALGIDEHAAMRRAVLDARGAVVRFAKLGGRPDWTGDAPIATGMKGANGKPIVAQWSSVYSEGLRGAVFHDDLVPAAALRKDVYPTGAFCPLEFTPEPQSFIEERAEYAGWWAALAWLATELTGKLASIAIIEPGAPRRPWIDEAEASKPPMLFNDAKASIYKSEARKTAEAQRRLGMRRHRDGWTRRAQPTVRESAGPRSYSVKLDRQQA